MLSDSRLRHLALIVAVAVAVAVAACGGTPAATFSAGDLTDVQEALALRGVTVRNAVSGDAGCADSSLHSNVVRLDLAVAGEGLEQRVHLFRWRRPAQFDTAAGAFADCVARATPAGGGPPDTLELAPWRAYGEGWTPKLRRALEEALRAVADR